MEPLAFETWTPFALSLALGLLVGFQRERSDSQLAGVRTFALITLFGTLCGVLADKVSPWLVIAGLASIVGLILVGNPKARTSEHPA